MEKTSNMVQAYVERLAYQHPAVKQDDDYYQDGILYCGKCKTPKETIIDIGGNKIKVGMLCKHKEAERDKRDQEIKEDKKRDRIRQLKERSNINLSYRHADFNEYDVSDATELQYRQCLNYAKNFKTMLEYKKGLLLYGPCGTGKTMLACCIGNYLLEQQYRVYMTSAVDVVQDRQANYGNIDKYISICDLLILDDMSAERSTDYARETIFNIIDARYSAGKPIIITTNMPLASLKAETREEYKRTYDRIFERCQPIAFNGKSYRHKKAKQEFDEIQKILNDPI